MAKHNENKTWAFVLTLIGSLLYLYAVSVFVGTTAPTNTLFGGSGAFFLPIFAGVGVICAVALFIASFGMIKGPNAMAEKTIGQAAMWGGIALTALFIGSSTFWYIVLGFFLTMVGGVLASDSK